MGEILTIVIGSLAALFLILEAVKHYNTVQSLERTAESHSKLIANVLNSLGVAPPALPPTTIANAAPSTAPVSKS